MSRARIAGTVAFALAFLAAIVQPAAAWVCTPGHHTPVDFLNGNSACLSLDGRQCYWLLSQELCEQAIANPPAAAQSLVCGDMMRMLYGNDGYGPGTWCQAARDWFLGNQQSVATTTDAAAAAAPKTSRDGHKFHFGVAIQFGQDSPAAYVSRVGFVPTVWTTYERLSDWFNVGNPVGIAWALQALGQPFGTLTMNMVIMSDCGLWCITDNGIAQLAEATRQINALGIRVLVIPLPEGNGYWFSYGNQPGDYNSVFRKIVWGMRGAGINGDMTKFGWQVNDASTYPYGQTSYRGALDTNGNGYLDRGDDPFGPYYPGDEVVDWIGISAYHYGSAWPWGDNQPAWDGKVASIITNSGASGYDLHQFSVNHGKNFAIFETAAAYFPWNNPGAGQLEVQRSWWRQVYSSGLLDRFWNLKMIVWFEYEKREENSDRDFRITTSGWVLDGFRNELNRGLVANPGEMYI